MPGERTFDVDLQELRKFKVEECENQTNLITGTTAAPESLVAIAPDLRFRRPNFEFQSSLVTPPDINHFRPDRRGVFALSTGNSISVFFFINSIC